MSRTLSLSTSAFVPEVFAPVKLTGHESLNGLFEYQLIIKTPDLEGHEFYAQYGSKSPASNVDLTAWLADGTVFSTLQTFGKVLLMAVAMHITWLICLFTISGIANGKNPVHLIKSMLPAYLTAVGTMSSAATIPVTLRSTRNMGVSEPVVNFVIPLCATIHLSGSTITLVTCTTAVMLMTAGMAVPTWAIMFPFIMMLGVTMVAAPGVPGGAVMAALGVLGSMLGFSEASLGLMIALYMAQDSFGTACNVTGDGVIALWIDRIMGKSKEVAPIESVQ